jgi:hypothetical protein
LPWFINGTLNESEQTLVDSHLKQCDECQADVESLIQMSTLFNSPSSFESIQSNQPSARENFLAALRADGGAEIPLSTPRRAGASLVSMAVILVAVLSLFIYPLHDDDFMTLSSPIAKNLPVVQIVFRSDTTEQTIRDVLLTNGNTVLSGPTRNGVYRVGTDTIQDARILMARLKSNPSILFVEVETP